MRIAVATVVLVTLLAGCVDVNPEATPGPPAAPAFNDIVAPKVDARATLDALKTFSHSFPYRQEGNAAHLGSREWLATAMKNAGLEVLRQKFPAGAYDGENIIGIKWGTDRSNWIVVGAHYDV